MQIILDSLLDDKTTGAVIDSSERYRYSLWRCWQKDAPRITFVMLNPSTADEFKNDPTITRCINFSKYWGFGSLEVVNLFAYRATNPDDLLNVADPVGDDNDTYILEALNRSEIVILAWGTKGSFLNRDNEVLELVSRYDLNVLGMSKEGHPKHPLYIRADTKPIPFRW